MKNIYTGMIAVGVLMITPALTHAQVEASMETNASSVVDTAAEVASSTINAGADVMLGSSTEANVSADVSIEITSASQVESESDLSLFVKHMKESDSNVHDVDAESEFDGDTDVEVTYKHSGKFLGLFPVTITSKTTVESDGETEVSSRLAWWSFLVTGENYNKAELESSLRSNSTITTNAKVNADAHTRAELAEAVVAEVAAHARAEASVE